MTENEVKTQSGIAYNKSDANTEKKETITLSKLSLWKSIAGVLVVLLAISVWTGGFNTGNDDKSPTGAVVGTPTPGTAPTVVEVSEDDDAATGDSDAPITIIEFSDYQCPFCGRFYTETLPQIKAQYIDTGKARLVFRDLPLSFHPSAKPAAEAAECARDQGDDEVYFKYHDKLFENVAAWTSNGKPTFVSYASELGLNTEEFTKCIDNGKFSSEVDEDARDASASGASGTPTFFINGQKVVGAQPFAAFKAVIDAQLS
ncbi:MAG: DsbA family protein [Nanoarchaeota archaeon]